MGKLLVDNATVSGTYGVGGLNGAPFTRMGSGIPKYIWIKITGVATVTMKGSYDPDADFFPVTGAEWTSSQVDGLYVVPSNFKFEIDIQNGSVSIGTDIRSVE